MRRVNNTRTAKSSGFMWFVISSMQMKNILLKTFRRKKNSSIAEHVYGSISH